MQKDAFVVFQCTEYMQCPWRPEEGNEVFRTGVTDDLSHSVGAGNQPWVLCQRLHMLNRLAISPVPQEMWILQEISNPQHSLFGY